MSQRVPLLARVGSDSPTDAGVTVWQGAGMDEPAIEPDLRRRLGAWYTPAELVDTIVDAVVTPGFVATRRGPIVVLDPACGDGRFLRAVATRIRSLGGTCRPIGIDIDPAAVRAARDAVPEATIVHADALGYCIDEHVDLVIGNPPFRSPLAADAADGVNTVNPLDRSAATGPYADIAVHFLARAADVVDPYGGRVAFVLPQSVLASRDAADVRASIDTRAALVWSYWSGRFEFDAAVLTCVLAFEFSPRTTRPSSNWASVVTGRRGIPDLPSVISATGTLGERAVLNANFRDQYYGMIPAVGDHASGPRLITTGLIDPGRSMWGERTVRFAGRRFARPRLDLDRLDDAMGRWARRRLVPKVLVATQTRVIEAVCDHAGEWLPAVPVIGAYPRGVHWDTPEADRCRDRSAAATAAWEITAVLTSPYASAWLWHRSAGTGMSANAVRVSASVVAELPWPADKGGALADAVDALRAGDLVACGAAVDRAYGIAADDELSAWWSAALPA